jgi:hypothetical protein
MAETVLSTDFRLSVVVLRQAGATILESSLGLAQSLTCLGVA